MSDWDRKKRTRRDRITHSRSSSFPNSSSKRPSAEAEDPNALVRLSKRMSELGICSRREADEWIEKGWVLVDGEVVNQLGTKVLRTQEVRIKKQASEEQEKRVTIILNKPLGYVSGQAEDGYQPAKVLIRSENLWEGDETHHKFSPEQLRHLVPAGRLDINSTGLLILTQDGRIAKEIIGDDSLIEKEYLVRGSDRRRLSEQGFSGRQTPSLKPRPLVGRTTTSSRKSQLDQRQPNAVHFDGR